MHFRSLNQIRYVAYMYTHVWPPAYAKVACTHACTHENPAQSYTILLDYINSRVDARACSRDILHAHVRYVGGMNLTHWMYSSMCATCARCACTHAHTQRSIVAMRICIYHWISISLNIIKYNDIRYRYSESYWQLSANWIDNLRENVTPKSLFLEI